MFRVIYFLEVLQPELKEATPSVLESGETAVEGACIDVELPQDREDVRRRRTLSRRLKVYQRRMALYRGSLTAL